MIYTVEHRGPEVLPLGIRQVGVVALAHVLVEGSQGTVRLICLEASESGVGGTPPLILQAADDNPRQLAPGLDPPDGRDFQEVTLAHAHTLPLSPPERV